MRAYDHGQWTHMRTGGNIIAWIDDADILRRVSYRFSDLYDGA